VNQEPRFLGAGLPYPPLNSKGGDAPFQEEEAAHRFLPGIRLQAPLNRPVLWVDGGYLCL